MQYHPTFLPNPTLTPLPANTFPLMQSGQPSLLPQTPLLMPNAPALNFLTPILTMGIPITFAITSPPATTVISTLDSFSNWLWIPAWRCPITGNLWTSETTYPSSTLQVPPTTPPPYHPALGFWLPFLINMLTQTMWAHNPSATPPNPVQTVHRRGVEVGWCGGGGVDYPKRAPLRRFHHMEVKTAPQSGATMWTTGSTYLET